MKNERPILFSAAMVRALLEGRKTQTRRLINIPEIIKPAPERSLKVSDYVCVDQADSEWRAWSVEYADEGSVAIRCPYGKPGDRLWVRETFGIGYDDGHGGHSAIPWTGSDSKRDGRVFYRATFKEPDPKEHGVLPWKPSIHMPRWASRITLEVTSVRVERLRDMSTADAFADGGFAEYEGCKSADEAAGWDPVDHFAKLWDGINGKRAPSASNPWVWVVAFRRVRP